MPAADHALSLSAASLRGKAETNAWPSEPVWFPGLIENGLGRGVCCDGVGVVADVVRGSAPTGAALLGQALGMQLSRPTLKMSGRPYRARGNPSPRSAIIDRWISLVPA
jgi:hypothetical protein